MKRLLIVLLLVLGSSAAVSANDSARGWCEEGNRPVVTSGLTSTTRVQASHPSCIITVNVHGDGLATIYADNNLTPLANPFTSQSDGQWQFYAANGRYDVTMSSAGFSQTITYSDILLCDPFVVGSTCNNGGTTTAHNLLSTTHLDTVPASPPSRGDLVVAQNQTSPTGVNPSWARLPLGTVNFVLTSNGTDAIWAPVGGSGCTLPGNDTGVLSEHPAGTCYNSFDWTWDDINGQNQLQGDGTSTHVGTNSLAFTSGHGNHQTDVTQSWVNGFNNTVTCDANTIGENTCSWFWLNSRTNSITDTGAGSAAEFVWAMQDTGSLTVTGASSAADVMMLLDGNTVSSTSAGHVDHIFTAGKSNTDSASGSGSVTSSIFQVGETLAATSTSGGLTEDNMQVGENDTLQTTAASTVVRFMTQLGYNHVFGTATPSVNMTYGFALGHANTTSTGATSTMTDFGMVGHNLTLTNCTDCLAIGTNIVSTASNTVSLGLSSAAEEVITSGKVALNAHLNQTATGKFAGSCAMGAATTCTFAISAAYSGTPLCITSIDAASTVPATANVAKCSVSGTTVTITAGISNSLTWDAILIGNPN